MPDEFETKIIAQLKVGMSEALAASIGDWVLDDPLFRRIIDAGRANGRSPSEIAADIRSVRG